MYYDYSHIFSRITEKSADIDIFENSAFTGFFKADAFLEFFSKYRKSAKESARYVSWDYVVLYAIIEYQQDSQKIISANFMTLEIPYGLYMKTIRKLWENCRFFFIRGRKEYYDE